MADRKPYILLERKDRPSLMDAVNTLIGRGYRKVSAVRCPRNGSDSYWCEMVLNSPNLCADGSAAEEGQPERKPDIQVDNSSRMDIFIHVIAEGGAR